MHKVLAEEVTRIGCKSGWEKIVPGKAAAIIKERHLFGYKAELSNAKRHS